MTEIQKKTGMKTSQPRALQPREISGILGPPLRKKHHSWAASFCHRGGAAPDGGEFGPG